MPRRWIPPDKHRPPAGIGWEEITIATAIGRKWAKYHPLFFPFVEAVEMSAGADSRLNIDNVIIETQSELLIEKASVDLYILDVTCSVVVGASLGEETSLILVNRAMCGAIHGYPVTADEIEKKRRKYR